jgi:hypothetical protein
VTNTEAAQLVAVLHGAYPNIRVDEALVETWTNVMTTMNYKAAQQAVTEWISSQTKFPTIAEINGAVRRIATGGPKPLPAGVKVADRATAQAAFAIGYERSRTELGDTPEQIDKKLEVYLKNWASIIPSERRASVPRQQRHVRSSR